MIEQKWERKLHIHTTGRDENDATEQIFPYEPTPYAVLERLVSEDWISSQDHVLDYGCGKGRVCIFLAMTTGCRATGVDVSDALTMRQLMPVTFSPERMNSKYTT